MSSNGITAILPRALSTQQRALERQLDVYKREVVTAKDAQSKSAAEAEVAKLQAQEWALSTGAPQPQASVVAAATVAPAKIEASEDAAPVAQGSGKLVDTIL